MSDAKLTGKVVFYEPKKEFGFIKVDADRPDVFFHNAQCAATPTIGDRVAFMIEDDPRRSGRQRAKAVTPI